MPQSAAMSVEAFRLYGVNGFMGPALLLPFASPCPLRFCGNAKRLPSPQQHQSPQ